MFNIWNAFSWRSAVFKYVKTVNILACWNNVLARFILPIFFLEVVCTKNVYKVEHEEHNDRKKINRKTTEQRIFEAFTTFTQIQRNIFSFMWKRTISLYWNLGTSEFLFSFCFFNLLLCPTTNCWAVVERTGSMIQCWCSFIAFFYFKIKRASWGG